MSVLSELLADKGYLILDGAMGTTLFEAGLTPGDAPERWNTSRPDDVANIHRSYIAAGSDVILTNTFGANRFRLKLHDLENSVREINLNAAIIARSTANEVRRKVLVAGSMGPSGELIDPLGPLSAAEVGNGYAEQAEALAEGHADLLWLETLSDLGELEAAVAGIRKVCDLPIAATMSYDTAGHTMMGVKGETQGKYSIALGLDASGINCGANLPDSEAAVAAIRSASGTIPVVSKANAGIPVWKGAQLCYDGTPEVLAAHALRVYQAGATLIGACCGSSPQHIEAIAKALSEIT